MKGWVGLISLFELFMNVPYIDSNVRFEVEIGGVCFDSRLVEPGCVFVCIEGGSADGHLYAADALKKGAAAVVVSKLNGDVSEDYVLVNDTREALALICANYYGRPADVMTIIGVTGTNGKTSVSHYVKHILEVMGKKVGLIGTNGVKFGDKTVREIDSASTTPEPLELHGIFKDFYNLGAEYVVMEVSSHALSQKRVFGINFEIGFFTNLTQDHLDYHVDMESYFMAKSILFDQCKYSVINYDDEYAQRLIDKTGENNLTFSTESNEADLIAKNIRYRQNSVAFDVLIDSFISPVFINIPGIFSVQNALAAIGAVLILGFEMEDILSAVGTCTPIKGRTEVIPFVMLGGKQLTVMIDYAHTPDGLKKLLESMKMTLDGRSMILVFGCGGDRDKDKRPQMGSIAERYADYVIVTSDNPRNEEPHDIISDIMSGMKEAENKRSAVVNRIDAIRHAIGYARDGDLVILAGKGHETYQEIKGVKYDMDEREILKMILSENRQDV